MFVTSLFDLIRPVPTIVWISLVVLFFGIGETSKYIQRGSDTLNITLAMGRHDRYQPGRHAAGYLTAAIGKMHFTTQFVPKENEEDDWPEDRYGFGIVHTTCDCKTGEYLIWLKEKSEKDYEIVKMQGECKAREDRAGAADKDLSGPPQVYPSDINPRYHQSAWIADRMIDIINESTPDQPFFALCSFVDPHHPFDPPPPGGPGMQQREIRLPPSERS